MFRENIKLLTNLKNTSPTYTFYKGQAINLVKACLLIGMSLKFHKAIIFKVSLILPDRKVKIKNAYIYLYPTEMAPLIKVKIIFMVKGQFGHRINPK